jgi:preprotein translocase subunit SecE
MKNAAQFLKEVRTELSRVEWPTWNEFVGATIVVLMVVLFFALFLGSVDRILSLLIKQIFTYSL